MKTLIEIYEEKISPLYESSSLAIEPEYTLLFLEEAGQRVLNFCRRPNIPPSLRYTVASIARDFLLADLYWREGLLETDSNLLDKIDINHVKKIAIGDTEVQLSTPKERESGISSIGQKRSRNEVWDDIINTYYYDLVHHRRTVFTGHHVVNIYE